MPFDLLGLYVKRLFMILYDVVYEWCAAKTCSLYFLTRLKYLGSLVMVGLGFMVPNYAVQHVPCRSE